MATARKKKEKEKDIIDRLLDNIGFRGLAQEEAAGQGGLIKQPVGRILQRALEMAEHLGYGKNSNEGGKTAGTAGTGARKRPYCLRIKAPL